jgi:hypothetical protein
MKRKKRKCVYFTEETERLLKNQCKREDRNASEHIRELIKREEEAVRKKRAKEERR